MSEHSTARSSEEQTLVRAGSLRKILLEEAEKLRRQSRWLRWTHSIFTFLVIVLGVAAPSFVTYASQRPSFGVTLTGIVLTAFVGAAASLRSSFKWGERFGSAALSALSLEELAAAVELQAEDIVTTVRPEAMSFKMADLTRRAHEKRLEIARRYLESETAVLAKTITGELKEDTNSPQKPNEQAASQAVNLVRG